MIFGWLRGDCRRGLHRQTNCFGEATDTQSLQHPGAVHLDGSHADAQIQGDDLVPVADGECIENLPLARAERRNPLSRCRGFAIPSRWPRYSQRLLDRAEEAFIVTRLLNEIDRTRLHCLHGCRYIAVPGHHDDRQTKAQTVEQSLKFEPVYTRHAEIQE
jgi:hypothetical protein